MSAWKLLPGTIAFIAAAMNWGTSAHGQSTTAHAQSLSACTAEMALGTECRCALSSLHPMQVAVGMLEVKKRVEKIKGLRATNKLEEYEHCQPEPVVIGPNDPLTGAPRFYITDHHHLARALLDGGESATECTIEDSQSALPEPDFWDLMTKEKKVWLYDAQGNPVTWQQLPKSLQELQDDPYRSLAWAVEKQNGFYKPCSDFGEFAWANFFRSHGADGKPGPISTPEEIEKNLKKVAKLATKLAQSEAAKGLPGYKKDKPPQCQPVPPGCGND